MKDLIVQIGGLGRHGLDNATRCYLIVGAPPSSFGYASSRRLESEAVAPQRGPLYYSHRPLGNLGSLSRSIGTATRFPSIDTQVQ